MSKIQKIIISLASQSNFDYRFAVKQTLFHGKSSVKSRFLQIFSQKSISKLKTISTFLHFREKYVLFPVWAKIKTLISSKLNAHDFFVPVSQFVSNDQNRIKTSPGRRLHTKFVFYFLRNFQTCNLLD